MKKNNPLLYYISESGNVEHFRSIEGVQLYQDFKALEDAREKTPIKARRKPEPTQAVIDPRVIVVDFDGTCVTHDFPEIGSGIGAEYVLLDLVKAGHKLVLSTMRSNNQSIRVISSEKGIMPIRGNFLDDAVVWFKRKGIPLYGIQTNPNQSNWTLSPKPYGDLYIDDAALGVPLIRPLGKRPYVDWRAVREWLEDNGYLNA